MKTQILIAHKESTNALTFYSGRRDFDEIHSGKIPQRTSMVFRKELASIYNEMNDENDLGSDMRFLFRLASQDTIMPIYLNQVLFLPNTLRLLVLRSKKLI